MGRVIIVDPDAVHAAELQLCLETFGYEVAVCANEKNGLAIIKENVPDLVVMVPRSPLTFGDALSSVSSAFKDWERRPELVFLLRWKRRGPAERLLGDRWNVQVLYER